MTDNIRQRAIELYDRFTHEGMDRRLFISRMVALAGSAAAAEALIGAIAASPAAAAIVPENDSRLTTATTVLANSYNAYVAEPRTRSLKAAVMVIHENRGLTDHFRDVARQVALAGFRAVAPDFLSPSGGTPADEDAAREATASSTSANRSPMPSPCSTSSAGAAAAARSARSAFAGAARSSTA
ncbi:MAG: dienelactone hydrolase family protein [Sphingomicrobium sp.]